MARVRAEIGAEERKRGPRPAAPKPTLGARAVRGLLKVQADRREVEAALWHTRLAEELDAAAPGAPSLQRLMQLLAELE